MKVILDIDENVLEKLAELAKFQKRSRKNFMELVLTNHAEVAESGTPEEEAYSIHNVTSQNKPDTAPMSEEEKLAFAKEAYKTGNGQKNASGVNVKNFNNQPKSDYSINTEPPVRMEGEDAIDFAIRKNEWKKSQK